MMAGIERVEYPGGFILTGTVRNIDVLPLESLGVDDRIFL